MTKTTQTATSRTDALLEASHTHLYRGAVLLSDLAAPPERPASAQLLFRDGVVADAEILIDERGQPALAVGAYATGSGTPIAAKTWLLVIDEPADDGTMRLRVGELLGER